MLPAYLSLSNKGKRDLIRTCLGNKQPVCEHGFTAGELDVYYIFSNIAHSFRHMRKKEIMRMTELGEHLGDCGVCLEVYRQTDQEHLKSLYNLEGLRDAGHMRTH